MYILIILFMYKFISILPPFCALSVHVSIATQPLPAFPTTEPSSEYRA